MQDLKKLKLNALVDLLNKHTNDFLRMLKVGGSTQEEYNECKDIIARLTAEIDSRKKEQPNTEDASQSG
jgi:hypothetical protein